MGSKFLIITAPVFRGEYTDSYQLFLPINECESIVDNMDGDSSYTTSA